MFFFTGLHPDYHSPRDEADKVNYEGLKIISDLVDKIVLEFANTSEKLLFNAIPDVDEMDSTPPAKMKVTLGVMPDYAYDGEGLKIDSVIDKRPGSKAGMLDGDIVIDIGGTIIKDIYTYMEVLSKLDSGSKVEVKVLRNDSEIVLQVKF